jgi:hypothetical protein
MRTKKSLFWVALSNGVILILVWTILSYQYISLIAHIICNHLAFILCHVIEWVVRYLYITILSCFLVMKHRHTSIRASPAFILRLFSLLAHKKFSVFCLWYKYTVACVIKICNARTNNLLYGTGKGVDGAPSTGDMGESALHPGLRILHVRRLVQLRVCWRHNMSCIFCSRSCSLSLPYKTGLELRWTQLSVNQICF